LADNFSAEYLIPWLKSFPKSAETISLGQQALGLGFGVVCFCLGWVVLGFGGVLVCFFFLGSPWRMTGYLMKEGVEEGSSHMQKQTKQTREKHIK